MNWTEVIIATKEENEDTFAEFLNSISKGISVEHALDILKQKIEGFEDKYRLDPKDYPESDIQIKVYFDETIDVDSKLMEIREFIEGAELVDKEHISVRTGTLSESSWENEWKKYFHAFRVSDHFVIVPYWELDEYVETPGDRLIKIEPGMAFGTGDHPTTSMCLTFIESIVDESHSVIDVGTGSGILSIGAYLMGATDITSTDIDELSLKVARENFALNDCAFAIEVKTADLLRDETRTYDVVIANILAHIVDAMIEDAYKCLNAGGHFIASGIVADKRGYIETRMKDVGFNVVRVLEDNGWVSIHAVRSE